VTSSTTVAVLQGNGDGTFQAAREVEVGFIQNDRTSAVVLADLNSDGNLDLAVTNQVSDTIAVLLGNGDGTFQVARFFVVGLGVEPLSLAIGDLNSDGRLDLVTGNGQGSNNRAFSVLLGNGDGTFRIARFFGSFSSGILTFADVNRDGRLDLVAGSQVFFGNGEGTFQNPINLGLNIGDYAMSDVDGDGRPDMIVPNAIFDDIEVLPNRVLSDACFSSSSSRSRPCFLP